MGRLPGQTALLVRSGSRVLAARAGRRALGVGTAFRIFVLKAIAQEVQDGRMRWDDVVPLRAAARSLPPGPLSRWADGAPLTVQSLATLMLARDDATATDHLLYHVGREVVEAHAGTFNRPLLSTREMRALRSGARPGLTQHWLAAPDRATRRALLPGLARIPLSRLDGRSGFGARQRNASQAKGARAPRSRAAPRPGSGLPIDPSLPRRLGWFFSVQALCTALEPLAALPVFAPLRGRTAAPGWRRLAPLWGRGPGLWVRVDILVHPGDGERRCVALGWNAAEGAPPNGITRRLEHLAARALRLATGPVGHRDPSDS